MLTAQCYSHMLYNEIYIVMPGSYTTTEKMIVVEAAIYQVRYREQKNGVLSIIEAMVVVVFGTCATNDGVTTIATF